MNYPLSLKSPFGLTFRILMLLTLFASFGICATALTPIPWMLAWAIQVVVAGLVIILIGEEIFVSTGEHIVVTQNFFRLGNDPETSLPLYNFYGGPWAIKFPWIEREVARISTGRIGVADVNEESHETSNGVLTSKAKIFFAVNSECPWNYLRTAIDEQTVEAKSKLGILELKSDEIREAVRSEVQSAWSAIAKTVATEDLAGNVAMISRAITLACNEEDGMDEAFWNSGLSQETKNRMLDLLDPLFERCWEYGVLVDFVISSIDLIRDGDAFRAKQAQQASVTRNEIVTERRRQSYSDPDFAALSPDKREEILREIERVVMVQMGDTTGYRLDVTGLEQLRNINLPLPGLGGGKTKGKP